MKALVGIEIPEGWELAEATARPPMAGEFYLYDSSACMATITWTRTPYPIIRKTWEWPAWLKVDYIAMNAGGAWHGFLDAPPKMLQDCWCNESRNKYSVELSGIYFDFTPPCCTDWKASLRKNPNA